MFSAPPAQWKVPGPRSGSKNTSQQMFFETDKIIETVNDLDSDGSSFSLLSNSNTCNVNSPFSSSSISSEEGEVVQPEPERGRKKTHRALPKVQIQVLSYDGKYKFRWFRNLHSPEYQR